MATKTVKTLSASTVDVVNAIRANASVDYRNAVPVAGAENDSIRAIGNIIMSFEGYQNEYVNALVNRIGLVLLTSKLYQNPWAMFKRGMLELGETVEEIFVDLAKSARYDIEKAENELFKREMPDVRSAFHTLNYKAMYKLTIQNEQLRTAFLSWGAMEDLIAKIVESMYNACNYDEFQIMKYMLARRVLGGTMTPVEMPAVSAANMKEIASTIKATSNDLAFLSSNFNVAGVYNFADKGQQYLICNTKFDATMDVEVLASAFNLDKAEFLGNRVMIDGFGKIDGDRLKEILGDSYVEFTSDELTQLNAIPAVLVDGDFWMIFDNLNEFRENYNGQGLYWNYFLHAWRTISSSPFANAIVFTSGTPAITSVTVSPATATLSAGSNIKLSATVKASNYASQAVIWSTNSAAVTVDIYGNVSVGAEATGKITVTATSVFDPTKSGACEITVS